MRRWQWALRLVTRRMWFRAALFCVFAVALALASALAGHMISYSFAARIGSKSVDGILNLLASSMLAVTTFALTAMVQAYSGATSSITPRAVQLLIDDSTSQNALATFLGSFLFAIVGIIALSTGIYGDTGRVILYAGTILVIALIVVTFLRWIQHIVRFGRVSDTIDRVERAAIAAVRAMVQPPRFGPAKGPSFPDGASLLHHTDIGRITHVDLTQIGEVAASIGVTSIWSACRVCWSTRHGRWPGRRFPSTNRRRAGSGTLSPSNTTAPSITILDSGWSCWARSRRARCLRRSTIPAPPLP